MTEKLTPDEAVTRTVAALLAAQGINKENLAAATGISRSAMFRRFNGKSEWKAAEVSAAAEFFGVEVSDLYDGLGGRLFKAPDTA